MGRQRMKPGTWGNITRSQNESGEWFARCWFRDEFGNRVRQYASSTTGAKAEAALIALMTDTAATTGTGITSNTTINTLADVWLERAKAEERIEDSTLNRYSDVIDGTVRPSVGSLRIHEATTSRLDRAFKNLIADGRLSRARNARHLLRSMFQMAEQHDAIKSNPMNGVRTVPRVKKDIKAIDADEVFALRAAIQAWETRKRPGPKATNPLSDIVDMLLATGVRIGEVLAIRWCDIDLAAEHPTIVVSGTLVSETGAPVWRKPKTKSTAGMRTLILPRFAVDTLLRRRVNALPADKNPHGAVFVTRNGTWLAPNNVRRSWRDARTDTGFEWVTPHTFRKSVATLVNNEVGSEAAAKQLGHASDDVTKEFYIQPSSQAPDLTEVLQKFSGK